MEPKQDGGLLRSVVERHSARVFATDPVPLTTIARVLEAGRRAPSGANQQPWQFVVVRDPATRRELRAACEIAEARTHRRAAEPLRSWLHEHDVSPDKPFVEQAPVLIAVFFDPRAPYAVPSVWIAIAFMLLQIEEERLSSLPYTPAGATIHPLLGVPERYALAALLPIGRGLDGTHQPRHPLPAIASIDRFDRPFPVVPGPAASLASGSMTD